jgi:hypothetical protein
MSYRGAFSGNVASQLPGPYFYAANLGLAAGSANANVDFSTAVVSRNGGILVGTTTTQILLPPATAATYLVTGAIDVTGLATGTVSAVVTTAGATAPNAQAARTITFTANVLNGTVPFSAIVPIAAGSAAPSISLSVIRTTANTTVNNNGSSYICVTRLA